MTIPTPASLHTSRRRADRRITKAELVLQAMQNGCSLQLQHTKQGPCWTLSNGKPVPDSIAALVVASASVVGVGDTLFEGVACQTYRWWREGAEGGHTLKPR